MVVFVVVGSTSPAKVGAAERGFGIAFEEHVIEVTGISVDSSVPDQPYGDVETRRGARTRAQGALEQCRSLPDKMDRYFLGVEGGIECIEGIQYCFAWICIILRTQGGAQRTSMSRTASFPIATSVTRIMNEEGLELGHAADRAYGMKDGKGKGGLVGAATQGQITRAEFYAHAIVLALSALRIS
jgi:inosine/xanthosine triphosphatase